MNIEQRKSLRTQIPDGHAPATLCVGETKVDVRILDESAGGFAVVVLADISLEPNQVHLLQTATGWCESGDSSWTWPRLGTWPSSSMRTVPV